MMTSKTIWREALKKYTLPPSDLSGSEWADKFRVVPAGTSPEPGAWRTSRTPYLREPVDVATDRETEFVVLEFSSQLGKSEALLNVIGYYADQEPAPQLMLQPTVEMAEAFSKERIEPMFTYSPGLSGKLEEGKEGRGSAKKSSTTIRMKHFPGGYLALVGANSPAGLASRPIRVLLCDEVDRYGVTEEGDPLKLAIQRTQNFANRKIILVSTPTVKGISKIDDWFERSDKRHFYVKCPHCGFEHKLEWKNVLWTTDEQGKADPMTAAMYCPDCGAQERGAYKPNPEMLESGRWIPEAESRIKGYHCNALYSPWVNLHELVREFLSCTETQDKHGLMEFVNLKLGEAWEQHDSNAGQWEHLFERREEYPEGVLPSGVLMLTAGIDVQHDRVECSVYGWGHGWECWGIRHFVVPGHIRDRQTQDQLDEVLGTIWTHASGQRMGISCAFIDSGDGTVTNIVYRYTKARERRRIFSIKGRSGAGLPLTGRPSKAGVEKATLFVLGVDSGKQIVMDRLENSQPGAGFVHYDVSHAAGFDEAFFKQLTAEVLETRFEKGVKRLEWVKIRERNEALDCFVYATAAAEVLTPNFEMLESYYSRAKQAAQQQTAPIRHRRRGNISRGVTI